MKSNSVKYYAQLSILTLTLYFSCYFLSQSTFKSWVFSGYDWLLLTKLAITLLIHYLHVLGFSNKENMHLFTLTGMVVRFLLSLVLVFVAVYLLKNEIIAFVINFFILYLFYTSFEIYFLLRNLRPDSKNEGTST
jgi:hypothetical protein